MNNLNLLECVRLLAVFAIVYLFVPWLVARRGSGPGWPIELASAFTRVCFFFQALVMLLGVWKLSLPGTVVTSYILWIAGSFAFFHRGRLRAADRPFERAFLVALESAEKARPGPIRLRLRQSVGSLSFSPFQALFLMLILSLLLQRSWYPLHNFRMPEMDGYSRALSLQVLTHGHEWKPDGSVALLVPLVFFSGLTGSSVIRFAEPLFSTALVLAIGLCAFRLSRSAWGACLACGLASLLPTLLGARYPHEIARAEMASLFVLLALVLCRESRRLAASAAVTALTIQGYSPDGRILVVLAGALACIVAAWAAVRMGRVLPYWARVPLGWLAAAICTLLIAGRLDRWTMEGPFQYEAAARACSRIARDFRRNDWLIVSPVHELAFTYGRGWHLELVDFVSNFTVEQVSSPRFSFPYSVSDVFVFIEKQPLNGSGAIRAPRMDLTQTLDRAVLSYGTALGRASVEFQAAALLAAYMPRHADVSTYYEDEQLVIYRIQQKRPAGADVSIRAKLTIG